MITHQTAIATGQITAPHSSVSREHLIENLESEYQKLRDLLIQLSTALTAKSRRRSLSILVEIAAWTGPRFRYHEEAIYPAIQHNLNPRSVEILLRRHDLIIDVVGIFIDLMSVPELTECDYLEAADLVCRLLRQVDECYALLPQIDRLPDPAIEAILDARRQALDDRTDLLRWSCRRWLARRLTLHAV